MVADVTDATAGKRLCISHPASLHANAAADRPAMHLQPLTQPTGSTPSALQSKKFDFAASAMPDHAALSFQPKHSSEPLHVRQPAQPLPAFDDNRRIAVAARSGAALAVQ